MPKTKSTAELGAKKHVLFGRYDGEDISWRVLKQRPDGALLQSQYVLDVMCFDSASDEAPTGRNRWRDATLRHWLNSSARAGEVDFGPHPAPSADRLCVPEHWNYGAAEREDCAYAAAPGFLAGFTDAERAALSIVEVETARQARSDEMDRTEDRVFLLSVSEVEDLMFSGFRPARFGGESWGWWTREPKFTGSSDDEAVVEVEAGGHWGFWDAAAPAPGIRPAVLLRPELEFEGTGSANSPFRLSGS